MFLFVHIPKNGGMSIRKALGNKLIMPGPGRVSGAYLYGVRRAMRAINHAPCIGHARWRDLESEERKRRAVAVIRNPWSRTVSRYTWGVREGDLPKGTTFRQFLEMRHEYAGREYFWHSAVFGWFQQKDFVTSESGQLRCDILRHRLLSDDACRYFGVPVGHENESNREGYRKFYGARERKIVADWFAEDIEFFGFTFDGVATKNVLY